MIMDEVSDSDSDSNNANSSSVDSNYSSLSPSPAPVIKNDALKLNRSPSPIRTPQFQRKLSIKYRKDEQSKATTQTVTHREKYEITISNLNGQLMLPSDGSTIQLHCSLLREIPHTPEDLAREMAPLLQMNEMTLLGALHKARKRLECSIDMDQAESCNQKRPDSNSAVVNSGLQKISTGGENVFEDKVFHCSSTVDEDGNVKITWESARTIATVIRDPRTISRLVSILVLVVLTFLVLLLVLHRFGYLGSMSHRPQNAKPIRA